MDGQSAFVRVDPHAIERAILAIAHNAVTYAPAGGQVQLCVERHGGVVDVTVRDNGPGFTHAALEHALERFWRDEAGIVNNGTGLGLAIARSIVEAAGGSITLENEPSGGAVVRLRFPAASR
jgi:two-component system sensor histidine kinase MprB